MLPPTADDSDVAEDVALIPALPSPAQAKLASYDHCRWAGVNANLEDMVVVVGIGEVGPWGSARTRWQANSASKVMARSGGPGRRPRTSLDDGPDHLGGIPEVGLVPALTAIWWSRAISSIIHRDEVVARSGCALLHHRRRDR